MSIGGPDINVAAPQASVAVAPSSGWQIPPRDGRSDATVAVTDTGTGATPSYANPPVDAAAPKLAALTSDDQPGDGSGDGPTASSASGDSEPLDEITGKRHKSKSRPSRTSYRYERSYEDYGYPTVGRRRKGDPRPGTMRYNLMKTLGGIY